MRMITCADCPAWQNVSENHGKCRADYPRAELVPVQGVGGQGLSVVTFWPETKATDYCGNAYLWVGRLTVPDQADEQLGLRLS